MSVARKLNPATIAMLSRANGRRRVAYIDTETTGVKVEKDRIWEIGAVVIDHDANTVACYTWRIRLDEPLTPDVANLTGIDATEVTRVGVDAASALRDFAEVIGDALVIGQNFLAYDACILRAEFARHGVELPAFLADSNIVDTMVLARDILSHLQADIDAVAPIKANGRRSAYYSLQAMAAYWQLPQDRAHRALSDAQLTALVIREIVHVLRSQLTA